MLAGPFWAGVAAALSAAVTSWIGWLPSTDELRLLLLLALLLLHHQFPQRSSAHRQRRPLPLQRQEARHPALYQQESDRRPFVRLCTADP
jgi:hypothetical protein